MNWVREQRTTPSRTCETCRRPAARDRLDELLQDVLSVYREDGHHPVTLRTLHAKLREDHPDYLSRGAMRNHLERCRGELYRELFAR